MICRSDRAVDPGAIMIGLDMSIDMTRDMSKGDSADRCA